MSKHDELMTDLLNSIDESLKEIAEHDPPTNAIEGHTWTKKEKTECPVCGDSIGYSDRYIIDKETFGYDQACITCVGRFLSTGSWEWDYGEE